MGENLTFLPCDHPTLPEALGKDPSLTVRITAVDFEAKKKVGKQVLDRSKIHGNYVTNDWAPINKLNPIIHLHSKFQ